MADRLTAPGGWSVEQQSFEGPSARNILLVRKHGYIVGEARTPAEVETLGVPIAELT